MAEGTEIKVNESDFNNAIQKIDKLIKDLCNEYKNIAKHNEALAMAWTGKAGDAFLKAAYSLERQYAQVIAKLKVNKEDLEKAKEAFLKEDNYIAGLMGAVIAGGIGTSAAKVAGECATSVK
ncbi:WXG100 family type VII secretion target [Clostridium uliginosum]|uniref:WXG100 family type VII secretion target n=1 Tax=Clostridium uliginosum TaxID=119641 RepID=A0A1I1PMR8_9CLOT|nr:WXG100 family type VII secretion target [Clostridium uliginosum]SFD11184.1 WXG100 family type VII secretion target [Clostridium uliginosum]